MEYSQFNICISDTAFKQTMSTDQECFFFHTTWQNCNTNQSNVLFSIRLNEIIREKIQH